MKLTFGCVVLQEEQILLVKEKSEKHEQLEKWNLVSGKKRSDNENFIKAVKREIAEETGIDVTVKGILGMYDSITPVDHSLYIVIGCNAEDNTITIHDKDIIAAQFFALEKFMHMKDTELVHPDMKLVTQNFLDGKYIDIIKTVRYE